MKRGGRRSKEGANAIAPTPPRSSRQRGCGDHEWAQAHGEHSITPSWLAGGASDASDASPTQMPHCFPGQAACVAVAAQPVEPAALIEMLTSAVWAKSAGPEPPAYEPVM